MGIDFHVVSRVSQVRQWVIKYERWLSPGALLGGFIIDAFTIHALDLFQQSVLLTSYLAVIATMIVVAHALEEGTLTHPHLVRLKPFFPLVALFTFGSLFSAFLIFYARDAALVTSWPFIAFIAVAFLGTEFLKKYHERLTFQLALLYFGIFSYSIFMVPVLVKSIGTWVFILSSVLSLCIFVLYVRFLWWFGKKRVQRSKRRIAVATVGIVIGMQILYFTNLIPPVPLALKDIGIYHRVVRAGDAYELLTEGKESQRFFFRRPVIHVVEGRPVYGFSSVFAPAELRTNVVHVWERYNAESWSWQEESSVSFSISGGRDEGYRGYTIKAAPRPGVWRLTVTTEAGLVVGRATFDVVLVKSPTSLVAIRK